MAPAEPPVVPGWRGIDAPVPDALTAALIRAHRHGARLISICSGDFVLARAGLPGGRRATTHWRYLEALRAVDPTIAVEGHGLYVSCDGRTWRAAGSPESLRHHFRRRSGTSPSAYRRAFRGGRQPASLAAASGA